MKTIELNGLAEAIAQEYIEGIDLETALEIIYDLELDHLHDLSESELLEEAYRMGIDTKEFEIEGE